MTIDVYILYVYIEWVDTLFFHELSFVFLLTTITTMAGQFVIPGDTQTFNVPIFFSLLQQVIFVYWKYIYLPLKNFLVYFCSRKLLSNV